MEILFGGLWRLVDGRDWKPSGWNIVLALGLLTICLTTFTGLVINYSSVNILSNILGGGINIYYPTATGIELSNVPLALAVMLITGVNILGGYKSFTWPWLVFMSQRLYLSIYKMRMFFRYKTNTNTPEEFNDAWGWFCGAYNMNNNRLKGLYEEAAGWHSFHTTTRFLVPSIAVCALTEWNLYYLLASAVAGFMFPFTTWLWKKGYIPVYPHPLNETLLGAVVIGGLAFLG